MLKALGFSRLKEDTIGAVWITRRNTSPLACPTPAIIPEKKVTKILLWTTHKSLGKFSARRCGDGHWLRRL